MERLASGVVTVLSALSEVVQAFPGTVVTVLTIALLWLLAQVG